MKITQHSNPLRRAAEQNISENDVLKNGMEGKSKQFLEKGAEVYQKA